MMVALPDLLVPALARLNTARYELWWSDPAASAVYVGEAARLIEQAIAELSNVPVPPPGPPPPPPPPPPPVATGYIGFAVTYAGHGLAEDCYLGTTVEQKEWGPHHGLAILAPVDGTVEAYQFGVGGAMSALGQANGEDRAKAAALFEGWTCIAAPPLTWTGQGRQTLIGAQQTMYVAVYRPSVPLSTGGGPLRALWFGHVRQDIATGQVARGGRIATVHDSGIRFEAQGLQVRAAHVHTCGSATGALTPNGDVNGLYAAEAMGWQVENRGNGPGPNEYLANQWIAGRHRSDWGSRPLPPMPS